MQTTSTQADSIHYGVMYMYPSTARALLEKSRAIHKHNMLVRQIEAERGPLAARIEQRRRFHTMQDLLNFADRRHGERRFDRTEL